MKEDKVTDEQVRGVTWQVNRLTSRRVNRLLVREDRVTDEQVRGVTERSRWDSYINKDVMMINIRLF